MNERDFNNYQRILAGYPPLSFTLLGFHLTTTIAGIAGLFAIAQSHMSIHQKTLWISSLAVLACFVTFMLWLMWFREHTLKDQAIKDLRGDDVRFPETPRCTGFVTAMHNSFYFLGITFWIVVAVCPYWFLS